MTFFKSIYIRTLFATCTATVLAVLVFSVGIVPEQGRALERGLDAQADNLVAALKENILSSLASEDMAEVVMDCLYVVSTRDEIEYISIVKPDGEAYVFLKNHWDVRSVDAAALLEKNETKNSGFVKNDWVDEETFRSVSLLQFGDLQLGYVVVGLGLDRYYSELHKMYTYTALTAAGVLLVGLFFSLLLAKKIVDPILELLDFTKDVIQNGFEGKRVTVISDDEVGQLATGFNHMAASVERKQQELADAHELLEKRVRLRTRELWKTNKQLVLMLETFKYCREGMCITDRFGYIRESNPAYAAMTRQDMEELKGKDPLAQIMKQFRISDSKCAEMWDYVRAKGGWEGEAHALVDDESLPVPPLHLSISPIYDDRYVPSHYVFLFRDISDLKEKEKIIKKQANEDALTGLPNRAFINRYLDQLLAESRRKKEPVSLVFIDVDDFKRVNDTHGHSVGDMVLKQFAERLQRFAIGRKFLGRLSGDEFVLIMPGVDDEVQINSLLSQVMSAAEDVFVFAGALSVQMSISCGVAVYPQDGDTAEQLLAYSDMAMYKAKSQGKNQVAFYDNKMHRELKRMFDVESELKQAVLCDQFELYYQPIIDAETLGVCKVEALIRWNRPDGRNISPDYFIPIAERSNAINDITEVVIKKAFRQQAEWGNIGWKGHMSVNLSGRNLVQGDIVDKVNSAAKKYDIDLSRIEFELTETSLMENMRAARDTLINLRSTGAVIVLDDFGTGYSSLQYLTELPVEILKIDKSFVADMLIRKESHIVVESITSLARSLGCFIVAEGVEKKEHVAALSKLGCQYLQGYYFTEPQPADVIIDYIKLGMVVEFFD